MQGNLQSQTSDNGNAKSTQNAIEARLHRETLAQRRGALVADVVVLKVDAREGLVDLRTRIQKNAAWSMVTGGKTSRNRQDQCAGQRRSEGSKLKMRTSERTNETHCDQGHTRLQ